MMKFLFYIFLFSLNFSCNGQEKSPKKVEVTSDASELKIYQGQKEQIEFKNYQMFYNGKSIKLETIENFAEIFGKPNFIDYGNLIYYQTSINPKANLDNKLDDNGNVLLEFEGREFSDMDKNGNYIEENRNLYVSGKAKKVYKKDKSGIVIGGIHTYRIWMSPYETISIVPDEVAIANSKIPALNGYITINGQLIHQSITKKELIEKLKPMPEGSQIVGMLGDPVLIYDLGDKAKDFDPNMDPDDPRVFIDIVFKIDPKTKEEKGIYYINYYYSLKDKD